MPSTLATCCVQRKWRFFATLPFFLFRKLLIFTIKIYDVIIKIFMESKIYSSFFVAQLLMGTQFLKKFSFNLDGNAGFKFSFNRRSSPIDSLTWHGNKIQLLATLWIQFNAREIWKTLKALVKRSKSTSCFVEKLIDWPNPSEHCTNNNVRCDMIYCSFLYCKHPHAHISISVVYTHSDHIVMEQFQMLVCATRKLYCMRSRLSTTDINIITVDCLMKFENNVHVSVCACVCIQWIYRVCVA